MSWFFIEHWRNSVDEQWSLCTAWIWKATLSDAAKSLKAYQMANTTQKVNSIKQDFHNSLKWSHNNHFILQLNHC